MTTTRTLTQRLDDSGLPHRAATAPLLPKPTTASPQSDPSRYHHPHFLGSEPGWHVSIRYYFTPFTGRERRPAVPDAAFADRTLTSSQRCELVEQYREAEALWSMAHLRVEARAALGLADERWQRLLIAREALNAAFQALFRTSDGRWKAALLRLTFAEAATRVAAKAWDQVAGQLAQLAADQVRVAGGHRELPITTVAREIGLDASAWRIGLAEDYQPRPDAGWQSPALGEVTRVIAEQRLHIHEAANLHEVIRGRDEQVTEALTSTI
ncbi:hypothetical protein OG422_31160 (plasmid) [Streptomyces sp. NBC_01525]|uniref:hypothetical protein n=1 Tax=Streptomyces sp. NBC_01525 TaxID=2903893 RepID=UPI002F90A875